MEGQDNFMAIIAKVDNPRLPQVIEEFEETISILFDPPEDMDSDGTVLTERGLIENRPHWVYFSLINDWGWYLRFVNTGVNIRFVTNVTYRNVTI